MAQTNDEDDSKRLTKITIKLITDHNITSNSLMSGDDIAESLFKMSHIRLDRLQIARIENLECLGCVTNLYLQQNCIECIENLEALRNLRFLTLAGNKIKKIQNLKVLKQLKFLDLSFNCIEDCDPDELPISLLILSLQNNPCTNKKDYRRVTTERLPNLKELDGIAVGEQGDVENISDDSSSDEDLMASDDDKYIMDDLEEGDSLKVFASDIVARAKIRYSKQNEQHQERMLELKETK